MGIVALLHADWLVLSLWEVDALATWYPDVAKQYSRCGDSRFPAGCRLSRSETSRPST